MRSSEQIYDEYLVASAATGDRPALERLIARWQPRLLRHAWRVLGDAERARDIVQEAWMEILRGLHRLEDVAAFPAWAYRIVSRRCYRAFGRAAREPFEAEEAGLAHEPEAPEHQSGEFTSDVETVVRALAELPAPQRAALALFYLEDMGVAEIAVALDVPPGTVKTRLMHARRKLRERLVGGSNGQV
jgi:RNA polymerase sigma factor (sigma-70 family)